MKIPGRRPPIPDGDEAIEPLVLPPPPNPDFYDPAWDAWKPKRSIPTKYVVIGLAALVVVVGIVYLVRALNTSSPPKQVAKPTLTPTTFTIGHEPGGPLPTIFSGDHAQTTSSFTVPSGLVVLSATCECTGTTFQISVLDSTGKAVDIPINSLGANEAGIFAGTVPLTVGPGSYTLRVGASGKWTAKITAPSPSLPAIALPRTWGSIGPTVIGPFTANQAYHVAFGLLPQPNSVQLQVIFDDGTLGPVLFNTTVTPKVENTNLGAQPKNFYLSLGDTVYPWGIQVANG